MKFIAFDIETAKSVPGTDFNWRPHRPLGISCIASMTSDCTEPQLWYSKRNDGMAASKMGQDDLKRFLYSLRENLAEGLIPLTWNGLGFDFDILAEESGLHDICCEIAKSHVDAMFHVLCVKGFPVALKNAAAGMGVAGKLPGVEGVDAPRLWAAGEYQRVMDYVAQDVRATLAVVQSAERTRTFQWTTRKGSVSSFPLSRGWLPVCAAMELPLPDTSWMDSPIRREDSMHWMNRKSEI